MAKLAKNDDVVEAVEAVEEAVEAVDGESVDSQPSSTGLEGFGLYPMLLVAGAFIWLGVIIMLLFWIREYSDPDMFIF
jgi:hypothetical protein